MDVYSERRRRLDSVESLTDDSCQDDTYETPAKKPYCPSAPVFPDLTCVSSPDSCDHLPDNLSSSGAFQMAPFSVNHINGVSDNGSSEAARLVPRSEHADKGHREELGPPDGDMGLTGSVTTPSCLKGPAIGLLPDGVSPNPGLRFDFDIDEIMCLSPGERDRSSVEGVYSFTESCQTTFEEQFNRTPDERPQNRSASGLTQGQRVGKTGRKEGDGEELVGGNGTNELEKVAEGGVMGSGKKGEGQTVKEQEGGGEEVLGGSKGGGVEDLSAEKEGQEMTRGESSEIKNKGANWLVNDFQREERLSTRSHDKAPRAGKEARTLLQSQITSSPLVPGREGVQVPSSEQVPSSPESRQSQSAARPPLLTLTLNGCSYSLFGSPPPPPLSPVKRDGSEGTAGGGLGIGTPIATSPVRHSGPVKRGAVREKRRAEADVERGVPCVFQESQVSYLGEKVTRGHKYEMTVPAMPLGPPGSQHGQKREPRKITSSTSLNDDVPLLHKAEKAWKPSVKKRAHGCGGEDEEERDPERVQTQELLKQVRSILNRLTPDTLERLTKRVTELNINTEEKLNGIIHLVFEKAIAEPDFSSLYASICHCLMKVRVSTTEEPGVTVNFLRLLLNLCQREFEKGQEDEDVFDRKQKEMDDVKDEEKRQRLKVELEASRNQAHRRSLGNIRFVGELFVLKVLPEAIVHHCVDKLLESPNEESLECLCKLLSTIGKDLDTEDAKPCVDQYFDLIDNIIKGRNTSTRIRFMLQDVLDLRRSNWVSRRRHQGPKTICQIHQEAEREELREQIKVQRQLHSRREGGGGLWSHGPHPPGGGWVSRLQFPGLKSNVQLSTFTTNQPERASWYTTSSVHGPVRTSSSTLSTIHRHEKTSRSTPSTIHWPEKTSSSTLHRSEKTSSSTPSTIHQPEKTSSSTPSTIHRPEKSSSSTPSTIHQPEKTSSSTPCTIHHHEKTSSSTPSTNNRCDKTSISTTSTKHRPERTSSSTSSTNNCCNKTSSSTTSTKHRYEKTSSSTTSTIHRYEKTSSSTPSAILRYERTSSSTPSTIHQHENTKAVWQCLAVLYQPERKAIKTVQVQSVPTETKLTKPETVVVTTVQPQPNAIKIAPPQQRNMKTMPPEPKETKLTPPQQDAIKSVQPGPKLIRLTPPDPVQRKQVCKTALSLVAFDREDWQNEKQRYMDMVKKHMDEDEGAGQDIMTELMHLMTHVADQRPGANGTQWQHPSDLTRRNYQILFRNQTPVFSLHEWQNHNDRHHKRFSKVPDVFERSPVV